MTIGQVDFDATATTSFATINIEFGFRYTTDISRYGSDTPFNKPQPEPDISQSPRNAADTYINPANATEI